MYIELPFFFSLLSYPISIPTPRLYQHTHLHIEFTTYSLDTTHPLPRSHFISSFTFFPLTHGRSRHLYLSPSPSCQAVAVIRTRLGRSHDISGWTAPFHSFIYPFICERIAIIAIAWPFIPSLSAFYTFPGSEGRILTYFRPVEFVPLIVGSEGKVAYDMMIRLGKE